MAKVYFIINSKLNITVCIAYPCKPTAFILGHSRTVVGLEQSCRDQNKMFLLFLDPLKQKKFMLKIFTPSRGTAIQRNMRRSVPQETHKQYEIVFVDGLLSSEQREVRVNVRCNIL